MRRPVELTATQSVPVPFAHGLRQPEICLPERVVSHLSEKDQETILAHELAHLIRRDPMWLALLRGLEAVFFFQPLNRVARKRLVEIAEYRCDDWAALRTGRRVDLARCLTEVASWLAERPAPAFAPAMAGSLRAGAPGRAPAERAWRPASPSLVHSGGGGGPRGRDRGRAGLLGSRRRRAPGGTGSSGGAGRTEGHRGRRSHRSRDRADRAGCTRRADRAPVGAERSRDALTGPGPVARLGTLTRPGAFTRRRCLHRQPPPHRRKRPSLRA